ncbi:MAG: helix-turn-helix domain-containing protein [Burkholderiaceae bacterium]|nr:helix-turn-helix domain-containing protein [Burkholderiaceae bacterium]
MKQVTPVDALRMAIKKAGGQSALARRLSEQKQSARISTANVWNWLHRDLKVPAEHCPDIEAVTGVKCEELYPNANWGVLRGTAKTEGRSELS